MHDGSSCPPVQGSLSKGEPDHQRCGGKSKTHPCSESPKPSTAQQAERKCRLTAGGSWQRLGNGDDFRVGFFGAPSSPFNQFGAIVAEVSDGSAERCAPEAEKDAQFAQPFFELIAHSQTAT